MNGALIRYYDSNRKKIAEISEPTAKHFADTYGLDFINESSDSVDVGCYFRKVRMSLAQLEQGRPFVVYADTDIVFNAILDPDFISTITQPIAMLTDSGLSPCTGFFVVKNDEKVKEIFRTWDFLGKHDKDVGEQETFLLLYRNFKWIRSITQKIPLETIIDASNANSGTIGKHFYSRILPPAESMMISYKKKYFDTIPAP